MSSPTRQLSSGRTSEADVQPSRIELADESSRARGCGLEVHRQLGDLVARR